MSYWRSQCRVGGRSVVPWCRAGGRDVVPWCRVGGRDVVPWCRAGGRDVVPEVAMSCWRSQCRTRGRMVTLTINKNTYFNAIILYIRKSMFSLEGVFLLIWAECFSMRENRMRWQPRIQGFYQ